MSASAIYELVGYLGSALIVISLTRKSVLKLRLFGMAGAVTFLVYGLLIGAYPIAGVNVIIIGVHVWFLRDLWSSRREFFTILRVKKDSAYLAYFLEFHKAEIRRFQPGYFYEPLDDQVCAFILRNMVPAGLFIGRVCQDHSVEVKLDFVIAQYRDFKAGKYLYSRQSGIFDDPRCEMAWSEPGASKHAEYLKRMGFVPSTASDGRPIYTMDLRPLHVEVSR